MELFRKKRGSQILKNVIIKHWNEEEVKIYLALLDQLVTFGWYSIWQMTLERDETPLSQSSGGKAYFTDLPVRSNPEMDSLKRASQIPVDEAFCGKDHTKACCIYGSSRVLSKLFLQLHD